MDAHAKAVADARREQIERIRQGLDADLANRVHLVPEGSDQARAIAELREEIGNIFDDVVKAERGNRQPGA